MEGYPDADEKEAALMLLESHQRIRDAAPDLLEACEVLLTATDSDTELPPWIYQTYNRHLACRYCGAWPMRTIDELGHDDACPVSQAIAAIAKAKGETP